MSSTTFSSGTTIASSWLNDVNTIAYGLGQSTGSSLVNFLPSGTGAVVDTVQGALRNGIVSVMYFIPTTAHAAIKIGTYLADLSVYIQAGIDAMNAAGGGILFFPYGVFYANVTLKAGVYLVGRFNGRPNVTSYGATSNPIISAFATGTVIDTPVATTGPCGVMGMGITGFGAGTVAKGIHLRAVDGGTFSDLEFSNFTNEALVADSGCIDCKFISQLAIQCLLNRSPAAKIGVFDIHGSDHYLFRVRGGASQTDIGTKTSANLYNCGILIRANNCDLHAIKGEFSDVGIRNTGSFNRWHGPQAQANYGHGIENTADGMWVNGLAKDNGQDTSNTYDGWSVSGQNGQYVNCLAYSGVAKVQRYGFRDSSTASDTAKNRYIQPFSLGHGTAAFNAANFGAPSVRFATGPQVTLANSATPSVEGYENFITNGAVLTITDFLNGVDGQTITIACNDTNTTIQHNGTTIDTSTGTNRKLNTLSIYRFLKWGGIWVEIAEKVWSGSATYDPASLADGAGATTTVTVTGAVLGDLAVASFSLDLQGITLTAWVSAADTVSVRFQNESGGVLDLASGTLRARVTKV